MTTPLPARPTRLGSAARRGLAGAMLVALPGAGSVPPQVPIPALQGRGHHSPYAGRMVTSSGIVTAVSGRTATVQDPAGDGDPATSDGILVQLPSDQVRAGDDVVFSGPVVELIPGGPQTANLSETTVRAEWLRIRSRDNALPVPAPLGTAGASPPPDIISRDELPVDLRDEAQARANRFDPESDALDFYEAREGMRVRVTDPVAVGPLERFDGTRGRLTVLADRGRRVERSRRTRPGGILLRSGPHNLGSQNPERIQVRLEPALHPWALSDVSVGDRTDDVIGVLRYEFGNFVVAATERLGVRPSGRAPGTTRLARSRSRLTVATYNVLNLSPLASDSLQRRLLAAQIVHHLHTPDILALQEIQDDSGEEDDGTTAADATLRSLAEAVATAGGPRYAYADVAPPDGRPGGAPGGNIRNAFLYDPARVALESLESLSPALLLGAGVRDTGAFAESRDPLIGVFTAGGRRLTVINNHLTSRYGSTPVFGALQPFVQAGQAERGAQADALRAYVADLLRRSPGERVIVLGDMNTFEFSDELVRRLPGAPPILLSLLPLIPARDRYTYNFEGNSQVLDHVFVTAGLRAGAELEVVHVNVDFPSRRGATASDHDPVIAQFPWPAAPR